MLKDIIKSNEEKNLHDDDINYLKNRFPGCFTKETTDYDGNIIPAKFDIEKFRQIINPQVDISQEGYGLNFLGKTYARYISSLESETVLVPDTEHNSKTENTKSENLYISGDNIDALKHLLKSYEQKVKCIYIDPLYNTGSDGFVYKDDFSFTKNDLEKKLNLSSEQAERVLDLTNRGSSSHSAWLMFMYPRLLLARELLKDDGVIFISIDDNEQADLKLLCDDVFGEDNFVSEFVWKCRNSLQHDEVLVSKQTERILFFCKNKSIWNSNFGFRLNRIRKPYDATEYDNPDNDQRGPWLSSGKTRNDGRPSYTVTSPSGKKFTKPWIPSEKEFKKWEDDNLIWWGKNGDSIPRKKAFLKDFKGNAISDILFDEYVDEIKSKDRIERTKTWEIGTTESGTKGEKNLFGNVTVFDYPKPWTLIKYIVEISSFSSDIILDFFSGSATTAHAVMQLNAEDKKNGKSGNRKYLMVQLPETVKQGSEAEKAGYKTIDQIGMERIKRAAAKIKSENNDLFTQENELDFGFKHYTIKTASQKTLDKIENFSESTLVSDNSILKEFGVETVLATWMNADGYGLTSTYQEIDLGNYTAYRCEKHLYLINADFTEKNVQTLCKKYEEEKDFTPDRIVVFGYGFTMSVLETLKANLKVLKDTEKNLNILFDIRY